jgi:hypothetical protein
MGTAADRERRVALTGPSKFASRRVEPRFGSGDRSDAEDFEQRLYGQGLRAIVPIARMEWGCFEPSPETLLRA